MMTRSLRRVLIPLVLLSWLAFRGIGLDAGGAPALLPLPPAQPRLALPRAADPVGDGPSRSTEVAAAAVPNKKPKKKPGEFLVLPQARRSQQLSVASSDSDALQRSEIRINNNGTIQRLDRLSKSPVWEISTGPPPSDEVTTGGPAVRYLIHPVGGNGNELVEYNNGTSVVLPWKLEDFVARTPYIQDSVVTIGSKVSTHFVIDADTGEVIYKRSTPALSNELEGLLVEGMPSKLTGGIDGAHGNNILMVVRDDYSLSASDLGQHLFNWTRSFFTAKFYNHPNTLDLPSYMLREIPRIKVPLALPDSTSAYAIVLQDVLPVASRDDSEALKPHRTSRKLPQTDGKLHVALDSTQNQTYDTNSEAVGKFTKSTYGWLFPVLPILLVIGYLLSLTSASMSCQQFVIQLIKPFMRDKKKPVDDRGRLEGTPNKRRKQRKRDGLVNGQEILSGRDKANAESGGSADTPVEENSTFIKKGINGLDGRQIGKLYVSNKEIGRGSNGTVVFEGSYNGRQVAVKRLLHSHNDIATKETENLIISDHDPNIVRLYGCERDNDFVYISLERCKCSLADLIQKHSDSEVSVSINSKISNAEGIDVELWTEDGLPSSHLLKLMRDVVAGLAHLHGLGIIHRDLKPHNVLISTEGCIRAKLSDMGISKRLQEDITSVSHHGTGVGSSGWQAPEQLRNGRQTRAMDLFSLGCLIFYCITKGKHPFGEYYERDMNIVNNRFDLFMVDYIPEAVHLLSQLLQPNPELRPSAVNVMHHPFFWSPELCLSFLRDTSDRIEKTSETDLINALESIGPVAFGGKWGDKLDPDLVTDMGRYRKYNFESIRDLLRYIRNKSGHYRELSDDLKAILGSLPEGFYRYFASRFPRLLIEVYKVMCVHCKDEEAFSKYFKGSLL